MLNESSDLAKIYDAQVKLSRNEFESWFFNISAETGVYEDLVPCLGWPWCSPAWEKGLQTCSSSSGSCPSEGSSSGLNLEFTREKARRNTENNSTNLKIKESKTIFKFPTQDKAKRGLLCCCKIFPVHNGSPFCMNIYNCGSIGNENLIYHDRRLQ